MNPKISIIMPVYNTEKYIGEAIESVLSQTFSDFEFIIIDDCSTDGSYKISEKYAGKDNRIMLYRNKNNLKIVKTLNKGIKLAKGTYIARMDSDDLLENKKLEKQINYLTDNPGVDILSSYLIFIDEKNKFISKRSYNLNIDQAICNESPICHACAIIKKSVFDKSGLYSEDFNLAEDYELWFRFYSKGYTFAILEEYLYYYRIFDDGGKIKNLKKQLGMTINVKKYAISKYGIKFSLINYIRLYIEEFLYYVVPSFIILKLFILIKGK